MTFRDSDVSASITTQLHILALVFTSDQVCSRAFTYVAIDMLPRVPSVLIDFLTECRPWRYETYINPPGFVPDALLSNESGRLEIGQPSPTFDIGFFFWDFDSLQDPHLSHGSQISSHWIFLSFQIDFIRVWLNPFLFQYWPTHLWTVRRYMCV